MYFSWTTKSQQVCMIVLLPAFNNDFYFYLFLIVIGVYLNIYCFYLY